MLERLLVVGLGSMGRRHVRLARQLMPEAKIIVLRHKECSDANEPGIDVCVTSIDDALRLRPQAAVVCNPASHHLDIAIPLADAGVHLLVEKPIATASQGVAELIELAHARGSVLMMGYNLRFLQTLQRFRELIIGNRVGRALSVRAETGQALPTWRPDSDYRKTVSAQTSLGGGVLLELSHDIDYLRWLFGEVRWVSAILSRQSALEIDVEDSAHLVLGFLPEGDEVPLIGTLNMDFVRHDSTRSCTVVGETGSLRWNAITGVVDVFDSGAISWQSLYAPPTHRDESYLAEWRHFLACINDGSSPSISGADGLEVLRVIEAARHSSNIGAVVGVNDGVGSSPILRSVE